jgi:hypothetical protein
MSDQSQTATNKQSEPGRCKQGCGFFVSTHHVSKTTETTDANENTWLFHHGNAAFRELSQLCGSVSVCIDGKTRLQTVDDSFVALGDEATTIIMAVTVFHRSNRSWRFKVRCSFVV